MAHILIIDDERPIRAMLRQMLEYVGYPASEASNGIKWIKRYHENPPDLILKPRSGRNNSKSAGSRSFLTGRIDGQ